jgi:hypothetical protein
MESKAKERLLVIEVIAAVTQRELVVGYRAGVSHHYSQ